MNMGLMTATPSSAAVVVQLGVPTTSVLPLAGLSAAIEGPQIPIALNAGWALVAVVAYGGLAVSVLGHTLYFGLIQKYEANLIASLTLICPLMAVGLGVLVTGDHFDARMLFGTAIALAGVLLILLKPRKAATCCQPLELV
jgi:O-acetylserine/cysteine efflux transporter